MRNLISLLHYLHSGLRLRHQWRHECQSKIYRNFDDRIGFIWIGLNCAVSMRFYTLLFAVQLSLLNSWHPGTDLDALAISKVAHCPDGTQAGDHMWPLGDHSPKDSESSETISVWSELSESSHFWARSCCIQSIPVSSQWQETISSKLGWILTVRHCESRSASLMCLIFNQTIISFTE